MKTTSLNLQPSEGIVVNAAATIYAAYIVAGRVDVGHEKPWMTRAIQEAVWMARRIDEHVQSDSELH